MKKLFTRLQKAGFQLPQISADVFPGTECLLLDGKLLSEKFLEQAKYLVAQKKTIPNLAVILVGDNPASHVYVNNKIKIFQQAGFLSESFYFRSEDASTDKLIALIKSLNKNPGVHGILVQLPLPKLFDERLVLQAICPQKDVDGFLPENIGALVCGDFSRPMACTPYGIMALLYCYGIEPAGKQALVIGRSNIVGKPMGLMLLAADATVTYAHSKTTNLQEVCQRADILVAAAGHAELIDKSFLKSGCVVIDVGIHKKEGGKLCGDVRADVHAVAGALTPVPGGVGPMTIAMLLVNTALAAWGS